MVRRIVLAAVIASLPLFAAFVAQGCSQGPEPFGSNCDPKIPYACCQCPWPEDCPPWRKEAIRKTLPDWCAPILIDAGCPAIYTYDRSFCEQNDAGADGDSDGGTMGFCASGTCVPQAPEAWKQVAFVMAWPELPPACPEDAPNLVFQGNPAPPDRVCPACSCDAPEGSCHMPATWTISSEICPGTNGVKTNFDPPSGWDGSCINANAIPKDKLCGGVPCVRSLTMAAPIIEEKPCTPHTDGWVDLPIPKLWNDGPQMPTGRACASDKPLPSCSGHGCGGTNSKFGACIMHDGDQVCPDGWTGDRYVLFGQIDDARDCTACACDPPTGGTCQVKWKTFSDAACSAENASIDIYAGMIPACYDYMPGVALGSKSASIIDYTKGSCAPTGGKLIGDVMLADQRTICCHSSTM